MLSHSFYNSHRLISDNKFFTRFLMYLIQGAMAGITQKNSVASFPLQSLQKQNSWLKISKNNKKHNAGISIIAYWRFDLR